MIKEEEGLSKKMSQEERREAFFSFESSSLETNLLAKMILKCPRGKESHLAGQTKLT